jgi:DNA polymerase I
MLNSHHSVRKALFEDDWLRVCWRGRDELKSYCKSLHEKGIPTFEGAVSPVLRHMVDNRLKPGAPRQLWVDIESDSRVPFSRKEEMRVLCWVCVDADGNEYRGLLDQDTDADEARLLIELWEVFEHYDQIMAWNGDRFDFPLIKARSELHKLLPPTVREWRRWLWLDHLELFKRLNMQASESGEEKQSFKLGVVAESVLGVGQGKIAFDASKTWDEWAAGGARRQRLLDYCAQDTQLMPAIEAKTGYILLLQAVSDTCGTFADSRGVNPSVQVEGFLARLALDRGYKFPTVLKLGEESLRYEGAYVLHPQKHAGIHRDVHVADFAGLYPSIIRTWNMSPETLLTDEMDPEVTRGLPVALSPLTMRNFRTDIPGILPEAVKQLMTLRSVWQKRKAALPPGTDEWKDADRRAGAYKITTNSFYGVIGSPNSRFYDRRVAESVTQCGRWLIVETIKVAERRGMKVIYGDTDSLFVTGSTRGEFEAFVAWCNAELYPELLTKVGCVENVISLAYEKQFSRLVITTAKKYAGSYSHYKGTDATSDSHPEIKGLEFKRGDSLRITRALQEDLTNLLVGYKRPFSDDPEDYVAIIVRWRGRVLLDRLELGDVLVSKRLGKSLDDYKADSAPMVRIARELEARGQDVGEGAKIDYVVIDAGVSPQVVIPADDYDPDAANLIDRAALWDKLIWPASLRLMEAAFPGYNWAEQGGLVKARKVAAKAQAVPKVKKRR